MEINMKSNRVGDISFFLHLFNSLVIFTKHSLHYMPNTFLRTWVNQWIKQDVCLPTIYTHKEGGQETRIIDVNTPHHIVEGAKCYGKRRKREWREGLQVKRARVGLGCSVHSEPPREGGSWMHMKEAREIAEWIWGKKTGGEQLEGGRAHSAYSKNMWWLQQCVYYMGAEPKNTRPAYSCEARGRRGGSPRR